MKKLIIIILLVLFTILLPLAGQAQEEDIECALDVIVQRDDWLSKLSDKFYGTLFAYPAIAEATNTKRAVDESYALIEDVDLIEPGWKLCIVGVEIAEEMVGFEIDSAPIEDDTPTNLTGAIRIGAAQAFSGPLAPYGQSIRNGIELAVNEVNQSNILSEATLEVIWQDTAGSPDQAVEAFESLIETEQVVAIIGPTLSRSAFAVKPLVESARIPTISSSSVAEGVTDYGDYMFRTSMPESILITQVISQVTEVLDLQRVVVAFDIDHHLTRANLRFMEHALLAQGIEIVAHVPFKSGETDFSRQFAQLQGFTPDLIVLSSLASDAANIITQARFLGFDDNVRFMGTSILDTPDFFAAGNNTMDGTLAGAAWNVNINSGSNRQFVADYQAAYGTLPDVFAAQAYTAVKALAAALRQADSTDGEAIRDALDALQFVESPLGLFAFNDNGNPEYVPVLEIVENGAFVVFQQ